MNKAGEEAHTQGAHILVKTARKKKQIQWTVYWKEVSGVTNNEVGNEGVGLREEVGGRAWRVHGGVYAAEALNEAQRKALTGKVKRPRNTANNGAIYCKTNTSQMHQIGKPYEPELEAPT